ncbi:MAG: AI-2E family transporter [Patescibacteria group bacterium]
MENTKRSIDISLGTILRVALVIIAFVFIYVLRDIALVILAAVVISSAIDPGVRWFEGKRVPRALGVVIIYLGVMAILAVIFLFVIPTFLSETSNLVANIPTYVKQINDTVPLLDDSVLQGYSPIVRDIADRISSASAVTSVSGGFSPTDTILQSVNSIEDGVVTFFLVAILSFYFSVTKDGVERFLRVITPLAQEEYVIGLWNRTRRKIGAWLQGQMFLGALVGSIIFLMLSIFHIEHALLLGFLMGVLEIIPVFGPTLAAVPGVMLALLDGGIGLGFIILLMYILVQQFESNIFYPLVVKKMVGISPILVIISLVVGLKLAGFLGLLLSVPVSVLFMEFMDDLDKKKTIAKSR